MDGNTGTICETIKRVVNETQKQKKGLTTICHKSLFLLGGATGDRTPDLMTASHALSQLSYSPSKQILNSRNCLPVSI